MISNETKNLYTAALKAGQKYYKEAISHGEYPYLKSLDTIVDNINSLHKQSLGVMDIPMELIAGTVTNGRTEAFAGNFMPLLDEYTEFGHKWMSLCEYHFKEGISDAVVVYEYLGKFYILEGNKRVSVLKSLGNPVISASVSRLMPEPSDNPRFKIYEEFLEFYSLAHLYDIRFKKPGSYRKLQASLGFAPDHVWTDEERSRFKSSYARFRKVFDEKNRVEQTRATASMAFLCWLQIYSPEELKTMSLPELEKSLGTVWPEIEYLSGRHEENVSTAPEQVGKSVLSRLFSGKLNKVCITFVHVLGSRSGWTDSHNEGIRYLTEHFGDRVVISTVYASPDTADEVMEHAVDYGSQLLIVTAPTLIAAANRTAALHPKVCVFVCALYIPFAGVCAYYSRLYEAKFIAGAIAASMSDGGNIGYTANYPIFGVPSAVNAFALGARLIRPDIRIKLKWTCMPGDPTKEFIKEGIRIFSGRELCQGEDISSGADKGTWKLADDGTRIPLSSPVFHWGKMYTKIVTYFLNGEWEQISHKRESPLSLWWGMDSGVMDIKLDENLPAGALQLAAILKNGIISGLTDPFETYITDNTGILRNDGSFRFKTEEIMNMDWFVDNVDGRLPEFDELLPMSQGLTRILGVYRDRLIPEKEAIIL